MSALGYMTLCSHRWTGSMRIECWHGPRTGGIRTKLGPVFVGLPMLGPIPENALVLDKEPDNA